VQVRLPFDAPTDSLNGGPPLRRVQALRLTLVSGSGTPDGQLVQIPIVRLRLVGAPWLKRDERTGRGIAGTEPGQGRVVATVIGTQDRDSLAGIFYESPPGVTDEPEQRQTGLEGGRLQVNERSLRLQAVGMAPEERAEAYVRFPEGEKSFLGYRQLRLWARGRGEGWGATGELQFYVKMGRDADNFYLYRTPVNAGAGRAAWEPEVRVDLRRFSRLRARLEQLFLEQPGGALACSGVDSLLVAATPRPAGSGPRFAVCEDGYVV
jgi:cell surface protein SprA